MVMSDDGKIARAKRSLKQSLIESKLSVRCGRMLIIIILYLCAQTHFKHESWPCIC